MIRYSETPPRLPALEPFVRCLWTLESPGGAGGAAGPAADDTGAGLAGERVLPDGCVELIFNFAAGFCRHDGRTGWAPQPRALLVGPTTEHVIIAPTGRVRLLGVRFRPGGALALLRVPQHELTDRMHALDEVAPDLAHAALEHADQYDAAERASAAVEAALVRRLGRRCARGDRPLQQALAATLERGTALELDGLMQALGVGARQLERRFGAAVGMPPKVFCRLMRFQRAVQLAQQAVAPSWTEIAYRTGYFDQAHLSREFRGFAGQSPAAYRREQHGMSDCFVGGDPEDRMPEERMSHSSKREA